MHLHSAVLRHLSAAVPRSTEDAALAALALRRTKPALTPPLHSELATGAWTTGLPEAPPNAFHSALSLLVLRTLTAGAAEAAAERALSFLTDVHPAETHWLWKWKFRLVDRHVKFDPAKYGWPWIPGTVSWVAPTALTMLAFRAWHVEHPRLQSATAMLLDRACPDGGWNADNSVVFGVNLDPHPDFTAMALLALNTRIPSTADPIRKALDYVATRLTSSRSTYSLAWATMALAAHDDHRATKLRRHLEEVLVTSDLTRLPVRCLALAALALEEPTFTFQEFK